MTAPEPDGTPDEPAGPAPPAFSVDDPPTELLATIGQRIAARLLDLLIVGVPLSVLFYATSDIDEARKTVNTPIWVQILAATVSALYEVVLIHLRGQTIGKRVVGIRVVRVTDGRLPDWTAAIIRYLLPILPLLVPIPLFFVLSLVVYLVAVAHPLRRGWHDRAAGTIVIKSPPPGPGDGEPSAGEGGQPSGRSSGE